MDALPPVRLSSTRSTATWQKRSSGADSRPHRTQGCLGLRRSPRRTAASALCVFSSAMRSGCRSAASRGRRLGPVVSEANLDPVGRQRCEDLDGLHRATSSSTSRR